MSFLLPLLWIWRNPFPLKAYPRQDWVRQVVIWWLLASSVANAQGMEAYPIESIPITSGAAVGLWAPASVYETFLAEKWCQQFLLDQEHQSGVLGEEEALDRLHDEVDINPDLAPATVRAIRQTLKKAKVLSYLPGRITDVEVGLELRDDAVPQVAAPRALGPAQTKLITAWIQEQVAMGLYEKASPGCEWASCVHIAQTW